MERFGRLRKACEKYPKIALSERLPRMDRKSKQIVKGGFIEKFCK